MRERDLYPPVRDWLSSQGWTVHVEIFDADVVAVKDGKIMVVELKTGMTEELRWQAVKRAQWSDLVLVAVPASTYRPNRHWFNYGIGVLTIDDRRRVRVRIQPRPQPWHWVKRRTYRLKRLSSRAPAQDFESAGMPSCRELRQMRERRNAAPT